MRADRASDSRTGTRANLTRSVGDGEAIVIEAQRHQGNAQIHSQRSCGDASVLELGQLGVRCGTSDWLAMSAARAREWTLVLVASQQVH